MQAVGWATGIGMNLTKMHEGPAPTASIPPAREGGRSGGRGETSPINLHDLKYTIKLPAAPPVD